MGRELPFPRFVPTASQEGQLRVKRRPSQVSIEHSNRSRAHRHRITTCFPADVLGASLAKPIIHQPREPLKCDARPQKGDKPPVALGSDAHAMKAILIPRNPDRFSAKQRRQHSLAARSHVFAERAGDLRRRGWEARLWRNVEAHSVSRSGTDVRPRRLVRLIIHTRSGQPFEHSWVATTVADTIYLARPHRSYGSIDLIRGAGLPFH